MTKNTKEMKNAAQRIEIAVLVFYLSSYIVARSLKSFLFSQREKKLQNRHAHKSQQLMEPSCFDLFKRGISSSRVAQKL